ncbi:unnamed protein product [Laminaria digitata]
MITRLFPLLVVSPLCVDVFGAPISYESYGFSPRKASRAPPPPPPSPPPPYARPCLPSTPQNRGSAIVTAHANGDLSFFIRFHIYCQEFKQICLDSLSDAKEMENLARRAAESAASSPTITEPTPSPRDPSHTTNEGGCGGGGGGGGGGGDGGGGGGDSNGMHHQQGGLVTLGEGGAGTGEEEEEEGEDGEEEEGEEEDEEDGEEPWGVVLRNTIIRDLAGFGMEHAGPIGRSLISKVLAVSQDNYPEMMEKCYIINAPWVFYALWKGVTPLVSTNTAGKIQVRART